MPGVAARWAAWDAAGRRVVVGSGASPATVTFPTTRLVSRVQIALGADLSADPLTWAWHDITAYVRYDLGITRRFGRADESAQVSTLSATLKLDNRDGRFSRRNPTSPYYGLLSKNTPIWVTVDAGSGQKSRIEAFVNEWPVRWTDKSANDCTVTIVGSGALRRLAQGTVLNSAQRTALLSTSPTAYWPCEDGPLSTQVASGLVGGAPMTVVGTPTFQGQTGPGGSASVADVSSGAQFYGPVSAVGATSYRVEASFKLSTIGVGDHTHIFGWDVLSGGVAQWNVVHDEDGLFLEWEAASTASTELANTNVHVDDGEWHHIRVDVTSSGGSNTRIVATLDGTVVTTDTSGPTYGPLHRVIVNPTVPAEACDAICHIAVWAPWSSTLDTYQAFTGYVGEMAHVRMRRLCATEGVPFVCVGAESEMMGPQGSGALLQLLRECEAADMGALYETAWGLGYQATSERYNAPVGMLLDFDLGHIAETPQPADDDQRLRNKWTVSRRSGSEFTYQLDSGPMGTGTGGPGVYEDSATVNIEADDQLPNQATWRVHMGTVDEDRWPSIDLNFAHSPSLIDAWCALPYGARITIDNPLPEMPPEQLDLVIEGVSERWDGFLWRASLNTSPSSPYRVYVVDSTDGNLGRVDMSNSSLAADYTSSDTSLSVVSTGVAVWTTGAVDFYLNIGGEKVRVTNIANAASPQTFTVTRSANGIVKAQTAHTKVSLWQPPVYAF